MRFTISRNFRIGTRICSYFVNVILLLAAAAFFNSAHAHRPYVEKIGHLETDNQRKFVAEILFGDGIFIKDPGSFQLRDEKGHVVAFSRTATHVSVICPNIDYCWAFNFDILIPFATAYRLDGDSVIQVVGNNRQYAQIDPIFEFKKYLSDDTVDLFVSENLEYPEFRGGSKNFHFDWRATIISPIIIILDRAFILVFVGALFFAARFVPCLLCRYREVQTGWAKTGLEVAICIIVLAAIAALCLTLLVAVVTLVSPWVYLGLSIWLGWHCANKAIATLEPRLREYSKNAGPGSA